MLNNCFLSFCWQVSFTLRTKMISFLVKKGWFFHAHDINFERKRFCSIFHFMQLTIGCECFFFAININLIFYLLITSPCLRTIHAASVKDLQNYEQAWEKSVIEMTDDKTQIPYHSLELSMPPSLGKEIGSKEL